MNLAAAATQAKQTFPASRMPSFNYVFGLKDNQGTVLGTATGTGQPDGTVTASFASVPDGTYTVTAVRLDMAGDPMGNPAESAPVDVVNTQEVDVPVSVAVTLG